MTMAAVAVAVSLVGLSLGSCSGDDPVNSSEVPVSSTETTASSTTTRSEAVPSEPIEGSTPQGAAAFLGPVRTIEANGIEIGYRQFGEGEPLLLIMGQAGTMSLWDYTLMQGLVEAGFEVTMFDNRGMAYSTDDVSKPLTLELMAHDTVALIEALGLEKPTVVGWSMGGEIALTLATGEDADKVGTIITCGSTPGGSHEVDGPPEVYRELADPDISPERLLELIFPTGAADAIAAFVSSIALYPSKAASPESIKRQAQAEDTYSSDDSVWDGLPHVQNKVVITNGSADVVVPVQNAYLLGERLNGAVVEVFGGAGHAALMQDQERFIEVVVRNA
ncbi:MAG: alpha/beta hydrolase [Actinobacteria bacterium]|nr:MAG: alpha/beta hydrolase [Actinomycetota bacterium]RIK03962.1 MAG: hypothetical protein DCC48_14750 [Acidobacteriota bacterium]